MDMAMGNTLVIVLEMCYRKLDFVRFTGNPSFQRKTFHFWDLFFFLLAQQPPLGQSLLIHEVSRSHTTTDHIRSDSSGRVISSSHRLLPDNTQQRQHTNIHALGGTRTHSLSRRAATDLCLRPRSHWDQHLVPQRGKISS